MEFMDLYNFISSVYIMLNGLSNSSISYFKIILIELIFAFVVLEDNFFPKRTALANVIFKYHDHYNYKSILRVFP